MRRLTIRPPRRRRTRRRTSDQEFHADASNLPAAAPHDVPRRRPHRAGDRPLGRHGSVGGRARAPRARRRAALDLVLDTLATVVTLAVALLGWARFRERGEPMAVFRAAAFLVLAIANGLTVALVITGLDRQAGMALAAPGQAPLYVFTFARVFAAALLVLGGIASIRRRRVDHAPAIVLGSAVAMLIIIALAQAGADRLPSLGFDRRARAAGRRTGLWFAAAHPDAARRGDAGARRGVVPVGGRPVTTAVSPRPEDRRRIPGDRSRLRGVRPGRRRGLSECLRRVSSRVETSSGWRST